MIWGVNLYGYEGSIEILFGNIWNIINDILVFCFKIKLI